MRGQSEPPGMRAALPVEHHEIRRRSKGPEAAQDRRGFPEGEESGNVGEPARTLTDDRLEDLVRGVRDDDDGRPDPVVRRKGDIRRRDVPDSPTVPAGVEAVAQPDLDLHRLRRRQVPGMEPPDPHRNHTSRSFPLRTGGYRKSTESGPADCPEASKSTPAMAIDLDAPGFDSIDDAEPVPDVPRPGPVRTALFVVTASVLLAFVSAPVRMPDRTSKPLPSPSEGAPDGGGRALDVVPLLPPYPEPGEGELGAASGRRSPGSETKTATSESVLRWRSGTSQSEDG